MTTRKTRQRTSKQRVKAIHPEAIVEFIQGGEIAQIRSTTGADGVLLGSSIYEWTAWDRAADKVEGIYRDDSPFALGIEITGEHVRRVLEAHCLLQAPWASTHQEIEGSIRQSLRIVLDDSRVMEVRFKKASPFSIVEAVL